VSAPATPPLAVGSTLWIFDENRRVYPKEKLPNGQMCSFGPIWREHWQATVITGETRVSWLVRGPNSRAGKISKRDLAAGTMRGVLSSERDLDAACVVQQHAYKIGQRVQRMAGGVAAEHVLRQIAALVGYEL